MSHGVDEKRSQASYEGSGFSLTSRGERAKRRAEERRKEMELEMLRSERERRRQVQEEQECIEAKRAEMEAQQIKMKAKIEARKRRNDNKEQAVHEEKMLQMWKLQNEYKGDEIADLLAEEVIDDGINVRSSRRSMAQRQPSESAKSENWATRSRRGADLEVGPKLALRQPKQTDKKENRDADPRRHLQQPPSEAMSLAELSPRRSEPLEREPKPRRLTRNRLEGRVQNPQENNNGPDIGRWLEDTRRAADEEPLQVLQQQHNELVGVLQAPKVKLPKFPGNPLKYAQFIRAFEEGVERVVLNDAARLTRLASLCEGEEARAIDCCLLMPPE